MIFALIQLNPTIDDFHANREKIKQCATTAAAAGATLAIFPEQALSGYNQQSTDIPLLIDTMKELIYNGKEVKLPLYDHKTGEHGGFRTITPCRVIILDGIMSLHYEIREIFTYFNIFFHSDDLVMRGLRLLVDLKERGYSVFEDLSHSDEEFASYNKWIYHHISFANLRISVGRERELSISP